MFPLIFYGGDIIKKRVLAFVMMMVVAFSCFALPASADTSADMDKLLALGQVIKYMNDHQQDVIDKADSRFGLNSAKHSVYSNYKVQHYDGDVWLYDVVYYVICYPSDWSSSTDPVYHGDIDKPAYGDYFSTSKGKKLDELKGVHYIRYRYSGYGTGASCMDLTSSTSYGGMSVYFENGYDGGSLLMSDVPIYDENGHANVMWSVTTDAATETATVKCSSPSDDDSSVSVSIHSQTGDAPSESNRIVWSGLDGASASFNKDNPYTYTIDLAAFRDDCRDKKSYSTKVYINVDIKGFDGNNYGGFIAVDLLNLSDSDSEALFSDKKDYLDLPDIHDYITDFPEFPEWDSEHPLDSIWAIVKWCGQCIIVVGKNLWGLMRWFKDTFVTLIKNLGIALYNLVVDIRRLLAYLFVPKSTNVESIVKKKFPSFDKVIKAFNDVKNGKYAPISFTLLGNDVTFDLLSISSQLRNGLYTASTIVIRVVELFAVIKCVFKAFGVNPSGGEEEGS